MLNVKFEFASPQGRSLASSLGSRSSFRYRVQYEKPFPYPMFVESLFGLSGKCLKDDEYESTYSRVHTRSTYEREGKSCSCFQLFD